MISAPWSSKRGPLPRKVGLAIVNFVSTQLRRQSSRAVARGAMILSLPFRKFQVTRRLLDEAQQENPLSKTIELAQLEVVLAVAGKDLKTARLAVESCLRYSLNPIARVTVVVEDGFLNEAQQILSEYEIVEECAFVPFDLRSAVARHSPAGREGWILQQIVGLWAARKSRFSGVLVLDSDTVFLRHIAFLDRSGVQLLQLSHEFVEQYERHASAIWGKRRKHRGLSYVTHYQLMQPEIMRSMFPRLDDLKKWVQESDKSKKSPVADYHSYGRFLVENFPGRYVLGRWGNKTLPWGQNLAIVQSLENGLTPAGLSKYYSVSLHSYLE